MPPDPRWMGPPEGIAAIFETGPGPASVLASQVVWMIETIDRELATGLSAVNTAATVAQWRGLGGTASAAAASGLNAEMQTVVAWTTHQIAVTQAAADAFTVAFSSVIPSVVCQTNRDDCAAANATNFFGMRTPEIVALDTAYFGEHYPHNSSVGWTYSAALNTLSAAVSVPPPIAPIAGSPASLGTVGAADTIGESGEAVEPLAQAASSLGETAGGTSSLLDQGPQLLSGAIQPATEVVGAPLKATQAVSGLPQSMMGSMNALGSAGGMFAAPPDAATADAFGESVRSSPATTNGRGAGSGGIGVNATAGGYPGAGLTSYTRPANSFVPENAGRPSGLRPGLLSAAEIRGLTTSTPTAGPATAMSPAATGMLHRKPGKGQFKTARVTTDAEPQQTRE